MRLHEWSNVTGDGAVRAIKYSFGVATATSMAARCDDGSWLLLSPPAGVPDAVLEELARDGDVSALVAPNGFHHMGQLQWRKRFANAVSYAPEGSLARLAKKSPDVRYRPLPELTAKLGARITLFEPEGMKVPDLLAHVGTKDGAVWFSGDLISNTQKEDVNFLPRLIFAMLGGGPGLRFNSVPAMVYLKDKKRWKATTREVLQRNPPVSMVPAHGDPIGGDIAARLQAILA